MIYCLVFDIVRNERIRQILANPRCSNTSSAASPAINVPRICQYLSNLFITSKARATQVGKNLNHYNVYEDKHFPLGWHYQLSGPRTAVLFRNRGFLTNGSISLRIWIIQSCKTIRHDTHVWKGNKSWLFQNFKSAKKYSNKRAYKHSQTGCADYNDLDVTPGLEALEKIRAFYTDKGIDILKGTVSLLGVILYYLFRRYEARNFSALQCWKKLWWAGTCCSHGITKL